MDLASFIPGVGPTSVFTPGATTPPPFNANHTGVTDGTSPATASNNVAEIYNRVLLNIAATVSTAGLTVDNNNWAQLPAAVTAIANQVLSGFTGTIVTPPQFDNDTSIATTQFVQRALGNFSSVAGITANTTLTSADAGKVFYVDGSSIVITINPAGLVNGASYTFIADQTYSATINLSTSQFRPVDLFSAVTSFTLKAKSHCTLVWDGTYFRAADPGALATRFTVGGDFGRIVAPSGLILVWGNDNTPVGEATRTVNLGWSFPTACLSVMLTGRSDGVTITNNTIPQLVSTTVSSFTYLNQGIAEAGTPVQNNQGVFFLAVGY